MPVLSWGHSAYWSGASQGPVDSPTPSKGGYPAWQTSIIAGTMLGGLQPVWEWVVTRVTSKKEQR